MCHANKAHLKVRKRREEACKRSPGLHKPDIKKTLNSVLRWIPITWENNIKVREVRWKEREFEAAKLKQTYLKVKEFTVSSVDDVGRGVRVCDIDEIHLKREQDK